MTLFEPAADAEREVVLAVDDNEQNLQLLEEYLWEWGYTVMLARDGKEAVEMFPRCNPALVVLDVMMPVMDGFEACLQIKATSEGRITPIVMLTALTGTDDKIRALDCGADDFLNKPINREELKTRISSLVKIRNLRKELDSIENIIVTLTSALENKDPKSGGHIHRVAAYSAQLADALGLAAEERETVIKGALLHDIGMIGVADEILLKPFPSNEDEVRQLADHTTLGASILGPLTTFQRFVPIVRSHHERFDGKGYPDKLAGAAIPLEARIVSVANRFDEIRHEQGLPVEEALASLSAEAAAGAFEKSLVETFSRALNGETGQLVPSVRVDSARRTVRPGVLCVDDSRLNRELMSATLAEHGYDVSHAENGAQALSMLASRPIDLVLLDWAMPVKGGDETLAAIRSNPLHQFLPVIVVTAHRDMEVRQRAIVAGADDFLGYPVNRLELVTRIRSLLRIKDFHRDLEQSQNVICSLALAIEAKDQYTRGHSQRVGDLAFTFARHLGLPLTAAEIIRTAGLLHDIGKIAVPEALLNKKGPLTQSEFMRVIDHPLIGEEICRPLLSLASALKMIRHHHERFDGRGYPDGLAGKDIPQEVRLISIVDAYDALTSHRSYRPAPLDHEAALETLRREADAGKWDPEMVLQFCAMTGQSAPDFASMLRPAPNLQQIQ